MEVFQRLLPDTANINSLRNATISPDAIAEDSLGAIWVGTGDGLCRIELPEGNMDLTRARFRHFQHNPSDPTGF